MKLGEALVVRKEKATKLVGLRQAAQGNITLSYDKDGNILPGQEDSVNAIPEYENAMLEFNQLVSNIHKTNAATQVEFNGNTYSLAGLISYREECKSFASFYDSVATRISAYVPKPNAQGRRVNRYAGVSAIELAKARKDDLDVEGAIATIEEEQDKTVIKGVLTDSEAMGKHDTYAKTARAADAKIQETNWQTDLITN